MPIVPLLQRFIDDELTRAPALIERTAVGTQQLLRNTRGAQLSASERADQAALVEALERANAAYRRAFVEALQRGVQAAVDEHRQVVAADAFGAAGLELMDESRVEIDIEISRAMQLIDTTAEWELRELQTFTSTLIGQTHVSPDSNPFRPLVYATALWEAAGAVSAVQARRLTLLRVSAGVAAGLLKSAWAAACTRLEAQGVEPGIYRTVQLAPGATPGRGPATADVNKPGALTTLLASMPAGSANFKVGVGHAAVPMGSAMRATPIAANAEFAQALMRLDELLRYPPAASASGAAGAGDAAAASVAADAFDQRVRSHRAALLASAATPGERQIIELLGRVFDTVLADPQIPAPYLTVLARIQGSALRVALREPEIFDSVQHPVWRWLDRIAEAGVAYPQGGDARAAALLNFVRELAQQLARAPAPDAALYRRALSQLDAFVDDQLQTQLRAAHRSVQALLVAERRELLEQQLSVRVAEQMTTLRTSPSMRRFMTGTWAKVLAEAMLKHGDQAETTRGCIKLVDELLWSLQVPDHPQSRQRLIALLPSMLARLRAGMASIALPHAEQDALLEELMSIHADALRPGRGDPNALSAEQIVQRMRDEVVPVSTGHGGFTDSVIDLASLETVPASILMAELPADDARTRIEALRPGVRLRLFLHGRWARVQLLWRSDQALYFLFAGESPGRTHSVTHRALDRLSSAGLVLPLEPRPLVQRALERVTRELARPD